MTKRQYRRIAAAAAALIACTLVLSLWIAVRVRDAAASRAVSSMLLVPRHPRTMAARPPGATGMVAVDTPLAACEGRIERQPHPIPTVAIVGASYTAGTGPGNPQRSWAVGLARLLHWNAVIYGVPGAGYVRPSGSGRGPMARMLSQEGLGRLHPSLVLVQAGHDDTGVPSALEERRVRSAVDLIHAAAPDARIGLLTAFAFAASPDGSPALRRTDHEIVTAATAADPGIIVMDPLTGRWKFPRAHDGLHPTAAGDAWIAREVASMLRAHGVRPAPASSSTAPVICDVSVGVGKPATA